MATGAKPLLTEAVDRLQVLVYEDREAMGCSAAQAVANKMKELLEQKDSIRMVFASAPSQNEFLAALCDIDEIDWSRVTAFHMDEWVGLSVAAPQSFGRFIRKNLFDIVNPGVVHLIDSKNRPEIECERYGSLLQADEIDIICLGIGENGHIAFNDPPVADFEDPVFMKTVTLDEICRHQQVHDGQFQSIDDVPTHGLTITIPALMSARYLFCIVPGPRKTLAVRRTLRESVTESCPASILRRHPNVMLFLDREAYGA